MLFGKSTKTEIAKSERGLVFDGEQFKRLLMPGEYTLTGEETVVKHKIHSAFISPLNFAELKEEKELFNQLLLVELDEHEIALHLEDGRFKSVLSAGRHYFWKSNLKHEFITIDLNQVEISSVLDAKWLGLKELQPYINSITVAVGQVGILSINHSISKVLEPGIYGFWKNPSAANQLAKPHYEVELFSTLAPFTPARDLNYYLSSELVKSKLEVIDILDHQLVLHLEDDKLKKVLRVGRYAFWKEPLKNTFIVADTNKPDIDSSIDESILVSPLVLEHSWYFFVETYEKGLLILDKNFDRVLEPGAYRFWKSPVSPSVIKMDMRLQQLEVNGQEIMTRDKVTLRINFVCQYKVSDPVKAGLEIKDYSAQLYVVLQLALREYLGSQSLDEVLDKKEAISAFIAEKVKSQAADLGLEITWSGIKDVILPGEVKDILNQVLIAERKAQANVITRREETASTRSLLNTAKLMEENETLYKLKELEYIERISEKINQISVGGGGQMLEQLRDILMPKK